MLCCKWKYLAFFPVPVLVLLMTMTVSIVFAQKPAGPVAPSASAGQSAPSPPSAARPASQAPSIRPDTSRQPADTSVTPPPPQYGPNDTIIVPAHIYNGEFLSARNLQLSWVTAPMTPAMRKRYEEWTRLRNAVYVTYPFARKAGIIMNEMNAKLAIISSDGEKKAYIKSREKDLKREFADPLEKLSVYQGRILMKLINRQTGNNCYDIIKEYKGGFTARLWQTVAFFFGSSLKQPYDAKGDDQQIEQIVQEVERMYRG